MTTASSTSLSQERQPPARAARSQARACAAAGYRQRVGGRGRRQGHECAGRILPDLEAQPLLFDLELGQLVLTHEVENLLQLIQVQSDLQQGRRDVRQLRPAWRHHDVVFDAHLSHPGKCAAGLDGEHHAGREGFVLAVDV